MLDREPRFSAADIASIRQKAKDSELLTPTPEQIEFRKPIFEEIDLASIGSGTIPRLLELTERLSGKPHQVVVFDTVELSVGSPFPVPTRYVVPMTEDEIKKWRVEETADEEFEREGDDIKIPDFLPGLVIRRWPAGMTEVQIGIDMKAEGPKVYQRLKTLSHHWREKHSFSQPYWWSYNGIAQDLTQDYDLIAPINLAISYIYADDLEDGLDYFFVGGHTYSSQVQDITYSTPTSEQEGTVVVWNQADKQEKLSKAFQYLETYFDDSRYDGENINS